MIFTLIAMVVLLALAVALLQLTGGGVTDTARSVDVNQAQQAANVGIQQGIGWLERKDLTGGTTLVAALGEVEEDTASGPRTAILGRSCYEWFFSKDAAGDLYNADKGTVVLTGRGISPGTVEADKCVKVQQTSEETALRATVKIAPSALGYALAGNGLSLGTDSP